MPHRAAGFALTLLLIEFLDEFVFGAREAAWPLIRTDLGLSYAQIGLLLGVPGIVSSIVEPLFGIIGDTGRRRALVLGGGLAFGLALVLLGLSNGYGWLLVSFILLYPASGAFVSLSQASLMDLEPTRHEVNMARWTFAGSLGVVLGPLALGVGAALGWGWRSIFLGLAGLTATIVAAAFRFPFRTPAAAGSAGGAAVAPEVQSAGEPPVTLARTLVAGARDVAQALARGEVRRWLVLLQLADLMLDVLLGYLALYLVDVGGVSPAQATAGVAVWTGFGLLGDFLMIPLLARVRGLDYLRVSAVVELLLFSGFLLVPSFAIRLGLLALLGLLNAGWYAILQAQLYTAMPGRSGTALAVNNVFGLAGSLVPWGVGLVAQRFSLQAAMWLLCLGPVSLIVGLRSQRHLQSIEV